MTANTATDRQTHSFEVVASKQSKFDAIVKKFQKRALKLGVEGPVVSKFERVEKLINHEDPATGEKYTEARVYFAAEVTCQPIKLAGWTFLATLSHEEGGIVLRAVPGATVPEFYRDAPQVCDHCATKRRRNETFVVQHDDGTVKQVGRQCIADFLGADPARALLITEFVAALRDTGEESDGGSGRSYVAFLDYLSWVAKVIREEGFTSRKAADAYNAKVSDGGRTLTPTSGIASGLRYTKISGKPEEEARKIEWPTDADRLEVTRAVEWVLSLKTSGKGLSDYEHNLVVVAGSTVLQNKNIGIAASLIPAFQRAEGRLKQRESQRRTDADSVHFGTVGKRGQFTLTVTGRNTFEGQYGTRHLFRLKDEDGNIGIWWTNNPPEFDQTPENRTYHVTATVKKFDDYNGIKQTVLSRLTFDGEVRGVSTTSALV